MVKRNHLAVSIDYTSADKILETVEKIAEHVVVIKIHVI